MACGLPCPGCLLPGGLPPTAAPVHCTWRPSNKAGQAVPFGSVEAKDMQSVKNTVSSHKARAGRIGDIQRATGAHGEFVKGARYDVHKYHDQGEAGPPWDFVSTPDGHAFCAGNHLKVVTWCRKLTAKQSILRGLFHNERSRLKVRPLPAVQVPLTVVTSTRLRSMFH